MVTSEGCFALAFVFLRLLWDDEDEVEGKLGLLGDQDIIRYR